MRWRAAALASLMVLGACTGGGTEGKARVQLMIFGEPEEVNAYQELIAAFEEEEPDIDVRLVVASDRDDLLARLATAFSGGAPPDLFLMNYRYSGQFVDRGVLEPLHGYVEDSDVFGFDDFYEPALEAFRFDGRQVCMPQNISSLVVYYNEALFEEAGVAFPEDDWTWDDMVEKATALTKDADGDGAAEVHGLAVEPQVIRVAPFIWSNGGDLVDDRGDPTRFTLDTPEAREALQEFFDLRLVHQVIPDEEEIESEEAESRFLNGRAAMVMSSRRDTPLFRTITEFDWNVAPLPRHDEQVTILHSDAYCMTKASVDKDAAWTFVEFALGPEGAPIIAASGRTVPSLIEVAESPVFLEPEQPPANARAFLDTIPTIDRAPNISTWPEIEDAAEPILEQGLYEAVPVDQVVREIEAATTAIFTRAR